MPHRSTGRRRHSYKVKMVGSTPTCGTPSKGKEGVNMLEDLSQTKVLFTLDERAWQEFNDLLEREPVELPKMRVLLSKRSVFEPEED